MNAIYNISIENKKKNLRFVLGKFGERPLIVMGVNPSTADMNKNDPTMRRVEEFVGKGGHDGFTMCNVFPMRCTNPSKLPERLNYRSEEYVKENIRWICKSVSQISEPVIWAAWGSGLEKRKYLAGSLLGMWKALDAYKPKWVHCGKLTVFGHPRHPLYLPGDATFRDFDMKSYILSRTL